MRDYGFEVFSKRYGYGVIDKLDELQYTPFQKKLANAIKCGDVLIEYDDDVLFGLAFNKSNIDISKFHFKQYEWRTHTRIERSSCSDDDLVMEVSDVAEESCAAINEALAIWIDNADECSTKTKIMALDEMVLKLSPLFDNAGEITEWRNVMMEVIKQEESSDISTDVYFKDPVSITTAEPKLLRSVGEINIVGFNGKFYALPQSLGEINFNNQNVAGIDGVLVAADLDSILLKLKLS